MVLTLLFFVLFTWLTVRLTRQAPVPLKPLEAMMAFGFKTLLAAAYGYLFLHYYGGDDTWRLHEAVIAETQLLLKDPRTFFAEWTPASAWRKSATAGEAFRYYLVDLEYMLLVKPLGIFNILSRGNYYSNAVCFSFLSFWGHYWLFRLLAGSFPHKRRLLLLLIFFFPPVVFWLSGLRYDGLLFACLSGTILHASQWILHRKKASAVYTLLGLAGILIFRNALLLVLLPGLAAWFITVRYRQQPAKVFGLAYGLAVVLFLGSAHIPGLPNLMQPVVHKQQQFLALQGNTRFALDTLSPRATSFIRVLPQAVGNSFFRPFVWEAKGMLQVMAALQVLVFWGLAALALGRRDPTAPSFRQYPVLWLLLLFSISLYVFIGYVIPFPGAIVRYKAIPELLLLILLAMQVRGRRRELPSTPHWH